MSISWALPKKFRLIVLPDSVNKADNKRNPLLINTWPFPDTHTSSLEVSIQDTEMDDSINDILPNEILSEILSQLAPWDLENCFNTCHQWRSLAYDILKIKGMYLK